MRSPLRLAPVLLLVSACGGSRTPPDLVTRLGEGEARAGVVTRDEQLIGGATAVGAKGDFKLYNAKVAFIVEAPGPSDGYDTFGGLVVDADVVRPAGEPGHSRFGESIPLWNFRTFRGTSAEVVHDGVGGGPAQVRVRGVDDAFPLIEAVLGQNRGPLKLSVDVDYILDPGADHLRIVTTLHNDGSETAYFNDHYVGYVLGDGLRQFLPGHGFDIPDLPRPSPYFAAVADDVSYSFVSVDSDFTPLAKFEGFLFGSLQKFRLEPGLSDSVELDLVVGRGDLARHEEVHRRILAAAGQDVPEVHAVSGRVAADDGTVLAGAVVHAVREGTTYYALQTVAQTDGRWAMSLPPGRYRLRASSEGRDLGPDQGVTVGQADTSNVALTLGPTGTLTIRASANGEPLPAKVLLKRTAGPDAAPASFGLVRPVRGYERVEFLPPGGLTLAVAPGEWKVLVTRGLEYEAVEKSVTVSAGASATTDALVVRSVDTTGWLGSDHHVHAQWSPDSDDLLDHKVAAMAGEGLEVPVCTEHEYIGDFQPTIAKLGLSKWMRAIAGEEVSTTNLGHFNAFPLERDPLQANFGAIAWFGVKGDDLMKRMRANPGKPLVQVNHPRSGSFGGGIVKGYLSAVGFDAATFTAKGTHDWTLDFDAMEVANGTLPDYADWFAFLDRGHKLLGTGDSDSHEARSDGVGYPRNYVFANVDSPEGLPVDTYMTALRSGRLTVNGGFFVQLGAGPHLPGDLVPASELVGGKLSVQVKVQAPSWVPGGTLELVRNGEVVASRPIPAGLPGTRLAETIDVDAGTTDGWFLARVVSDGTLAPVYPGFEAFGFSNPIWLDVDGNGRVDPRLR
ncbi:MAG: hypothetical protein RL199_1267 [Pseudomonadota bacterium]|jgi:hypothetical protein